MRSFAPALKLFPVLVLVGAMMWYCSENSRLRLRGQLQVEKMAQAESDLAAARSRIRLLEKDLLEERMRQQGITELVETAAKRTEEQWDQINEKLVSRRKLMPEGLRRSLIALNECLREDGYTGMRFMGAASIQDKTLTEAEMYEHEAKGLGSDLYLADEVTFLLDREKGKLTIWFRKGTMVKGGERRAIPAEGYPVVLPTVFGPMWERQLPFLIRAEGEYPDPKQAKVRPKPLDPVSRGDWLLRLEQLTRAAKTHLRYRVDRFRGLEDATFQEVLLVGYDDKKRLAETAEVAALQVVVDKRRGTVELMLRDGLLRKQGGQTHIDAGGYRILLLGVTPKEASDSMMGMVVQK